MDTINSKRIARNTMFLYVRMVLTMFVSLFTVRLILKVLGVEDYGIYNSIAGVISTLSFISSVLANASQRFYSYHIGKNDKKSLIKVFGTVFLTYCAVALLIIIIAETIGLWFVINKMNYPIESIDSIHWIYQFTLASFVITLLANPFQAVIISFEKMNLYAYMSVIEVLLKLGIVFLLFYCSFNKLKLYSFLLFISVLLVQIVYMIIGGKIIFKDRIVFSFSKSKFKEIFNYTSWTLFGTIASVCNSQGLNILLNIFYGPLANAAYAISSQVSAAVNSLASNFFVAVRPPLIKSYAQNDVNGTNALFYFSTKVVFVLLFIIVVPIIYKTEFILGLWLGEVSTYMVSFVRCILIYSIVVRLSDPITVIQQAANKVKSYHGIVDTFTVLSLPVSYICLQKGSEAQSVFFISISIMVIAHVIRLFLLKQNFQFSIKEYTVRLLIPFLSSTVFLMIFCYFLDRYVPMGIAYNIISIIIVFIVSICSCWIIIFKKTERVRMKEMFSKILKD